MLRNACITLEVRDLDQALAFWAEGLGLAPRLRVGDWAEVAHGDFRIALRRVPHPTATPAMTLGFGADHPLADLTARLSALGAEVGEITEDRTAEVRLLPFRSPDGHGAYFWTSTAENDTDAP